MLDQFYIIDGHSLIYRFHYAPFRPLTSPDGEPTKATYLFTRMILKLIREKDPAYLAVAMDGPRHLLRRRQWDAQYKNNRSEAPSEVSEQVKSIRSILQLLSIPVLTLEGYEADDIIATLATKCVSDEVGVTIVTGDKDLGCLLADPRIRLYEPQKEEYTNAAGFTKKKGFSPEQATDVMSLMGDSSDNIPTIKGFGPKTATKFISLYNSLDKLIDRRSEIQPIRLLEALDDAVRSGRLALNRRLVALDREVPLRFNAAQLTRGPLDLSKAAPIFRRLGFSRWYEEQ